jgi:two-component system, cell cycle response regulator DivK
VSGTRSRILVVDDSAETLDAYAAFLEKKGFAVVLADNGDQALQLARSSLPDAILLDQDMPGMTGCQVARALHSDEATRRIPVIMLTGKQEPAVREEALRYGCTSVLLKPCRPEQLVEDIVRAVHRG